MENKNPLPLLQLILLHKAPTNSIQQKLYKSSTIVMSSKHFNNQSFSERIGQNEFRRYVLNINNGFHYFLYNKQKDDIYMFGL